MRKRSATAEVTEQTQFRSLEVRAATFSEESRSVDATISTELPVLMPDFQRMEMVPEVLLSAGVEYPKSRQVPFLDSHQRRSVKDQLGSARGITVNDGNITARLHFSQTSNANEAMSAVREGHITDVSVGYDVLKRTFVDVGKTKTIGGRTFEGPVNVVTKWRLREVSLTPIGADEQAKLRGLDPAAVRFQSSLNNGEFEMNSELRALLVSKGMPESHTDEQAQRWLIDNADKLGKREENKPEQTSQRNDASLTPDAIASLIAEGTRKALLEQESARAKFHGEVDALCDLAGLPEEKNNCRSLADVAAVREHLRNAQQKQTENIPYGAAVRFVSSGYDRLVSDVRGALVEKAVRSAVNGDHQLMEKYLPAAERSKNADQFRHASLLDFATELVRAQGIQTLGLTRDQIAKCAMFGPNAAGIRNVRSDAPYHTTGSFANLTLDAINKSMMVGYQEVPATWRGPMRQGESVPDFKNINRIRLGGIPNLPVWNGVDEPDAASFADAKETYAVEARSLNVSFSYKLIVNDDMSALTRVPMSMGDAAARTVNAVAWQQITSNPTMSDGVSLFSAATGNRKQTNVATGSVSDYTAAINSLTAQMMVMKGENTPENNAGADILGLMPRYIAFPAALRGTILQLIGSEFDPKASVAGIKNINMGLTPVMEPLLDGASTTAWYLFADTTRIDTVEVTFLQGQETPQVRAVMDEHTLAMNYYVLQSVGAKPLNHRGIQRHAGA